MIKKLNTKKWFVLSILVSLVTVNLYATKPISIKEKGHKSNFGGLIPYDTVAYYKAGSEKMKWWRDAKFGLFVHWRVYSVPGGIWSKDNTFKSRFDGNDSNLDTLKGYSERLLEKTDMPLTEYKKITNLFDWSKFNARDFINLCFASGQHYIVITTKHHDGFAIWPSVASNWNIGDATPYGTRSGRDPLKELAEACHATKTDGSPWEIKMCFYYSHCADWWEDDAAAFNYDLHTDPTTEKFQNYLDRKVKPQLTELLTNYGEIGMIWFDVPRVLSVEQAQQLRDLVNKLSPNTIIDGRLGHNLGDYVNTGDNGSVGAAVDFPWESGSSINESFGYRINSHEYKTPKEIIDKLIDVVAHGGNYLLNIGPRADGTIPEEDIKILREVGEWTKPNSEAIFGTRQTPYIGDKSVIPEWGTCTQKGNNLYLIVTHWPEDNKIIVPLLQNEIRRVSFLADPDRNPHPYKRLKDENGNDIVIISVPDKPLQNMATVIAVECADDHLKLVPYKHAYNAAKKEIYLSPANFQVHADNVKNMSLYYDRDEKAIVNWRYNKGNGATVAWTYDVPEPGKYVVQIDYAIHQSYAGLPVNVLVDENKQLSFVTEDTGGNDVYKKITLGTVNLNKGRQDFALDVEKSDVSKLFVMQLKGVYLIKK